MDFIHSLTDALVKGTPWAVLIAAVGALWQIIYVYFRDRSNDMRVKAAADLERKKFEYQKSIEELKFDYEQRRWREQLITQIGLKHVETRLAEYSSLWSRIEVVARHRTEEGSLTVDLARGLAGDVKNWRYSTGGFLAEKTLATPHSHFRNLYGIMMERPRVTGTYESEGGFSATHCELTWELVKTCLANPSST
jgi:hypothetical protein